jgi:hypothetical protein
MVGALASKILKSSMSVLVLRNLGRSKMRQIGFVGQMVIMLPLLSACAVPIASETSRTICRELARDLPTYSTKDTPETLESGARFIEVYNAVCPL